MAVMGKKELIQKLQELNDRWPKNYWLFSASGTLHLMEKKDGKMHFDPRGGVDQSRIVETFSNIHSDGGDW